MENNILDIQELLDLEDIEENEMQYYKKYGYYPFNVSTWNPTKYFSQTYLKKRIQLNPFDYIPYLYSYELDKTKLYTTKTKLGGDDSFGCLITNTGTSAISLVTSVLHAIGIKNILVICPVYYAALYNFLQKGINIIKLYIEIVEFEYQLPQDQIMDKIHQVDAIWLTNPVYNTGMNYSIKDIEFLKSNIPSNIQIICDDCFAPNGQELVRYFYGCSNYISIHDPLKQIMINGLKFACILYPRQYEHVFEQWSDIICGSLSYSTVQSMDFFNSEGFDNIHIHLSAHFKELNNVLLELIDRFPKFYLGKQMYDSHMHMCIASGLAADYLQDKDKMYSFMQETGSSIIPGNRFHFPNSCGFSFRINMGRESKEFWDALFRILQYLSSKI